MSEVLVVGGRQKPDLGNKPEWHAYAEASIVSVDLDTGGIRERVAYTSPEDKCADDPSIVFKSATLADGRLYACTQTEAMMYDADTFECLAYVSHPWFNDVHYVRPSNRGTLLVANTGLDMVMEVSWEGALIEEWNTASTPTWERFSQATDYRRVATTKPHDSHPNHLFLLGDDLWVTRGQRHDAVCLSSGATIKLESGMTVHDGIVRGDSIYFTSVDGKIVVVDQASKTVARRHDLPGLLAGRTPLGWCRGLEFLDDDRIVVGFSRIRPTRWHRNVRWLKHMLGGRGFGLRPTRLLVVNLAAEKIEWECDLEPHLNAVFSIHKALQ